MCWTIPRSQKKVVRLINFHAVFGDPRTAADISPFLRQYPSQPPSLTKTPGPNHKSSDDRRGGEAEFDDKGAILAGGSRFGGFDDFAIESDANVIDQTNGIGGQTLLAPLQQTRRTTSVGFGRENLGKGVRREGRYMKCCNTDRSI